MAQLCRLLQSQSDRDRAGGRERRAEEGGGVGKSLSGGVRGRGIALGYWEQVSIPFQLYPWAARAL